MPSLAACGWGRTTSSRTPTKGIRQARRGRSALALPPHAPSQTQKELEVDLRNRGLGERLVKALWGGGLQRDQTHLGGHPMFLAERGQLPAPCFPSQGLRTGKN